MEEENNEDDIDDLAKIVIDNDVYNEDLIELTMEHEEVSRPSDEIPEKRSKQSSKGPKVPKQTPVQKPKQRKTNISQELSDNKVTSKARKRNTISKKQVHEPISKINTDLNLRRSSRERRLNVNYTD